MTNNDLEIEATYRKLAEHLDRLPGGFAPSDTGADIRLLQGLFTPEEAELAINLILEKEDAQAIAKKSSLSLVETEKRLHEMAEKGLIYSVQSDDGRIHYQAAPWVVGIYEFQVNRMDDNFIKNFDDYYSSRIRRSRPETISQMRTIPIHQSIDSRLEVLPYEHVEELVKAHDKFAVAPCVCRRHAKMKGEGCDAPEESCLVFGEFADFYLRTGRARAIKQSEVWDLLAKANDANLVLNPTNSKFVSAICCCCGDCCGILKGLQYHPKPSEAVASSFIAEFDEDACLNCGICIDRCQMQAITAGVDRVEFNSDRCIGCGLCVSTCPSGALTLTRKPGAAEQKIPDTFSETWYTIAKELTAKK
ncbi:MAG: 4Fe-4S binding protein [Candidatus Bathyarchaeota archaeon]|nr:4Fe-4S binding protein [Candidatus Bathyarchaeota archaeon]